MDNSAQSQFSSPACLILFDAAGDLDACEAFDKSLVEANEALLHDLFLSDATLFTRTNQFQATTQLTTNTDAGVPRCE